MPSTAIISSILPKDYGFVALAASSTFLLHIYQVMLVGKHRKLANITYPNFYASKEEMETNPAAKVFNCAQRAHGNTLEILPHILFGTLWSGLFFPIPAAVACAAFVVGRVLYTVGYVTGNPQARYAYGGQINMLGAVTILCLSFYTSIKLILA